MGEFHVHLSAGNSGKYLLIIQFLRLIMSGNNGHKDIGYFSSLFSW